jgi:hypothetical protein
MMKQSFHNFYTKLTQKTVEYASHQVGSLFISVLSVVVSNDQIFHLNLETRVNKHD